MGVRGMIILITDGSLGRALWFGGARQVPQVCTAAMMAERYGRKAVNRN